MKAKRGIIAPIYLFIDMALTIHHCLCFFEKTQPDFVVATDISYAISVA